MESGKVAKKVSKEEYLSRLPEDSNILPTSDILPNKFETEWICNEGHVFKKKVSGVLRHPYCTLCNPPKNQIRYSYQDVVDVFRKCGYEFLDRDYVNSKYKHKTRCLSCGDISVKNLNMLLSGKTGCSVCGKRKLVTQARMDALLSERGYKSWTGDVKTGKSKIHIVCDKGEYPHYFTMTCRDLLDGHGCPHCAQCFKMDTDHVNWLFEVQSLPYRVLGEYKGPHTTQEYQCKVCDTVFTSRYKIIQSGRRSCPSCYPSQRDKAFNERGEHLLYYLRIEKDGNTLYKIGVTGRTVEERFPTRDLAHITVIQESHFKTGEDAYLAERELLLKYSDFKYVGDPVLSSGNTELFTRDVLFLDKDNPLTSANVPLDSQPKAS